MLSLFMDFVPSALYALHVGWYWVWDLRNSKHHGISGCLAPIVGRELVRSRGVSYLYLSTWMVVCFFMVNVGQYNIHPIMYYQVSQCVVRMGENSGYSMWIFKWISAKLRNFMDHFRNWWMVCFLRHSQLTYPWNSWESMEDTPKHHPGVGFNEFIYFGGWWISALELNLTCRIKPDTMVCHLWCNLSDLSGRTTA